jgi:hypothetical protein
MALKSGFYNAVETESGVYDRTYSADEYTNFYSAFLKDGVRRSGMNDFVCSANGLIVTIGAGYAICGSKWIHNDTAAVLAAITPPTGQYSRIDGVFLRVDTNEETRAASFVYRNGTAAASPVPPAKDTTAGIFELCLCYVNVAPNATTVSITDKRGDPAVCGWVTSPVGYDDYFELYDSEFSAYMTAAQNAFDSWFSNLRETVATTTLFKQYTQYIRTTTATTSTVDVEIVQYDPTGVDILQVYCNGMLLIAGSDYLLNGTTITFTTPKILGTEILIVVYKSIDGAGLGSVSDEVTELQNQVSELTETVGEISELVSDLFYSETIERELTFDILGHQQANRSYSITKAGFKPIGITDIYINTDAWSIVLGGFYIKTVDGASTAYICLSNVDSSRKYVTAVRFKVLYQRIS